MSNSNVHRGVLLISCALILSVLNFMIFAKERIVSEGANIYLALAPVDPRAILQGDYMTLRFELAAQLEQAEGASVTVDPLQQASDSHYADGKFRWAEIALDADSKAKLAAPGTRDSLRIRYRTRGESIWLGTNAFFFQEGDAARFERAKFGHFKLSKSSGEAILVGLVDENLQAL